MDAGQNDDLQSAINGIVNAGAGGAPAPIESETPDLGVPPIPPVPGVTAGPDLTNIPAEPIMPEPVAPTPIEPAAPEVAPVEQPAVETPVVGDAPVEAAAEAPAESVAESVMNMPETAATSELSDVKKSMIQDLIPLINHVSLDADKKFGFYKEAISSTHDKTMVPAAYEAVKGIEDETKKAEALLYLIDEAE